MVEDGEIEDGEVSDSPRREENGESEKRKATSPPQTDNNVKKPKIEDDDMEEGEYESEDEGEIISDNENGMDVDSRDLPIDDLCLQDVELLQDRSMRKIDWSLLIPEKPPKKERKERDEYTTASILRAARVHKNSKYLIRDPELLKSLEDALAAEPEIEEEKESRGPIHSNLREIIVQNRQRIGMPAGLPLRPFKTPTVLNGALAHEVTQLILDS
ncbi:Oidioi.mRNA.OKI2018_I69.chr1.g3867.t1.cds [Oikopleura dioica]|uniref:Oidioi.mRNA.OKI2018_I69.chr1.g3867.t1.cds n=1 Tax=Oikopleura dioica TaxID=34765 RepID=A0ABN7T110_OIKDI|nr:Oidioi.mRNA.OKI2018_I69.chr1.g3867.t1.cds [Oikopleura dioica]